MNITGNLENGVLTIGMEGRIDTTNAAQAEEEIQKLEAQDHGKVVLYAEKLEYISSAGLRVIPAAAQAGTGTGHRQRLPGGLRDL